VLTEIDIAHAAAPAFRRARTAGAWRDPRRVPRFKADTVPTGTQVDVVRAPPVHCLPPPRSPSFARKMRL
jgi:hypothetical protein